MDHPDYDEDFQRLVEDGIWFMRSITRYYGFSEGLETWDLISLHLGPEVKTEMFLKMLDGQLPGTLVLKRVQCQNAIKIIKTLRSILNLGLKEAKDIWDATERGDYVLRGVTREQRLDLKNELGLLGMEVR